MDVIPINVRGEVAALPGRDETYRLNERPETVAADNYHRATLAAEALKRYAVVTGSDSLEYAISDLLGDLRHLVDCLNADEEEGDRVEFDELSDRGYTHYSAETRGE